MIKAIIFDCFGVLTTDGWLPFKEKYFGNDEDRLRQATELNHQVDSGLIEYSVFTESIAKLTQGQTSPEEVRRAIESNVPNEQLLQFIAQELKPSYKLGMLSNAGANWLDRLFTAEQVELFDATALSYETGVIKPDPRAYQAMLARLGVEAEESVFIDDQERFCTAAREQGMHAIWYTSVEQLKANLAKLLQ